MKRVDRCDICAIKENVRHFYLTADAEGPNGGRIRRGVGSIVLCGRCWSQTGAKRRRPRRNMPKLRLVA